MYKIDKMCALVGCDKSDKKTSEIGLSVSTQNNPFFVTLVEGARKAAKDAGLGEITVVDVYHGGMIGKDGQVFLDACKEHGVNSDYIKMVEGKTGHTIIQVDKNAQNSILLFGGANQKLTESYVDEVLESLK